MWSSWASIIKAAQKVRWCIIERYNSRCFTLFIEIYRAVKMRLELNRNWQHKTNNTFRLVVMIPMWINRLMDTFQPQYVPVTPQPDNAAKQRQRAGCSYGKCRNGRRRKYQHRGLLHLSLRDRSLSGSFRRALLSYISFQMLPTSATKLSWIPLPVMQNLRRLGRQRCCGSRWGTLSLSVISHCFSYAIMPSGCANASTKKEARRRITKGRIIVIIFSSIAVSGTEECLLSKWR